MTHNSTDTNNDKDIEFEKQKIVYEKASELHRYYLSWRQFLFAGFIAVIGLIIFKCCDMVSDKLIIAILLFISAIVSIVFYYLDKRNSRLYHICQKVESRVEDEWFGTIKDEQTTNSTFKLYKSLDSSHKEKIHKKKNESKEITHTVIIKWLYIGCSIFSFALCILFLILFFTNGK